MSWKLTASMSLCVAVGLWGYVLFYPKPSGQSVSLPLGAAVMAQGKRAHKAPAVHAKDAIARHVSSPQKQRAEARRALLIHNATIWTATGQVLKRSAILVKQGRIAAIGKQLKAPAGARVIDAKGRILTPGLIDTHSHMGVYPAVGLRAASDGNEWGRPVTGFAWAEHAVWTQDPAFPKAVAGGTTTVQILPGSANLIGGRGVTVKLKLSRSVEEMKFPGAPHGLKMACGENPKSIHRSIKTRMGSYAGYRIAFLKAKAYRKKWQDYQKALVTYSTKKKAYDLYQKRKAASATTPQPAKGTSQPAPTPTKPTKPAKGTSQPTPTPTKPTKPAKALSVEKAKAPKKPKEPKEPTRDINLDSLKLVLEGKILVHIHCYRAEEMIWMMRLAREFGFKIRSFHHAVEAYKIRDILAKEQVSVSTWADWWGFKLEAYDGIQENAALVHAAGGRAIIHSDSSIGVQRLNHEAGKAFYRGRAMGLSITEQQALQWITIHPAWALGIHKQTGSIEVGKMADLVLWDTRPFSVYSRTSMVFIDGELVFDRRWPPVKTDFELGLFLR